MLQKSDLIMGVALALTVGAVACAHGGKHEQQETLAKQPVSAKPAPDAGASIETKQVAAESSAPFVTEVAFKKGSADLNSEMTKRLRKIYEQAAAIGEVSEITSFAWADREYPQKGSLPEGERHLADQRNAAIAKAFDQFGSRASLKEVTMTERPSVLSNTLQLGDTREKNMFEEAGIRVGDKNKKASPKAGKAVVMIRLKR